MKNFLLLLIPILMAAGLAKANTSNSIDPTGVQPEMSLCDIMAPSNFQASTIGTTSVTLTWDIVPDAVQYRVRTIDIATGQVSSDVSVQGNSNSVEVTGLTSGASYRSEIKAVCQNGQISSNVSFISYQTFILELVVSGFTDSNSAPNCSITSNGNDRCTFPISSSPTYFKVTNGSVEKQFTLRAIDGKILFTIKNNLGIYQFWGILEGIAFPVPPPVSEIKTIRLTTGGGEDLIAHLIVESNTNGLGTLKLGPEGIATGYSIHRLKAPLGIIQDDENDEGSATNTPLENAPVADRSEQNTPSSSNTVIMANPFTDEISLKIQSKVEDLISIQLFDLQGRLLKTQDSFGGEAQYVLPTGDIPAGLYILRVEIGAYTTTLKVVKS